MKVMRGQKHDEFQPLDEDEGCEERNDGKERKNTKKTRRTKSQSNKDKGTKKFVPKHIVKGSSKSKYSYLDGSFPIAESSDVTDKKSEANGGIFDGEFSFCAVFDDVHRDISKKENDYSFDAVFDNGVNENEPNNANTSVEQRMSKLKSAPSYATDATSTCSTSCAASTHSSLRVSDVSTWDVASRVSLFERNNTFPFQDVISTSCTSSNDDRDATNDEKPTTSNPSTTRVCNYDKVFDCPPEMQTELDERLCDIRNLQDITIQQGKRLRMMQLSNKAYRIRAKLFHKEITNLQLQNADLKDRVTRLEDDLRVAKADATVSDEDANRPVLVRQEIHVGEVEGRDKNVHTIGDLFAEHNASVNGKQDASATISENTSSFSFDAFNLNRGNTAEANHGNKLLDGCENPSDSNTMESNDATIVDTHEEEEKNIFASSGQEGEEEELSVKCAAGDEAEVQEKVGGKKESHITLEERVNFFPFTGW
eukprot:CAMPEP_0178713778 /NCGR_PEP_ID=MMETSP0699-20121125/19628_1 /TAXON_ID=265572 /ORGANISM="Extubocellulus spinifer, Strain CCMP396" /LENGTH=480 /DNA_ID=CAMNT_0020362681 /DNA_START=100 /DNA_END=1539 /DNA_ORIENTATION=-